MARVAVYPGSFDPITYGHLDIIKRSLRLFDKVIVAVLINEQKKGLFSFAEREQLIAGAVRGLENVEIKTFDGLLVQFMRENNAHIVLRGIRDEADFSHENTMAQLNYRLDEKVETVFIPSRPELNCISSSAVKEIASFRGDVMSLVPLEVAKALEGKCRN